MISQFVSAHMHQPQINAHEKQFDHSERCAEIKFLKNAQYRVEKKYAGNGEYGRIKDPDFALLLETQFRINADVD